MGGGPWSWRGSVSLADHFHVEDQQGLRRDDGRAACLAVGQLVRDIQTALAAHAHALKAGVPAWDNVMRSVRERDGLATVNRGVELGAIGQIAGVVHG